MSEREKGEGHMWNSSLSALAEKSNGSKTPCLLMKSFERVLQTCIKQLAGMGYRTIVTCKHTMRVPMPNSTAKLFILIVIISSVYFYHSRLFMGPRVQLPIAAIRPAVPLILLFTYNHSVKTRDSICQGIRNGGSVVDFDRCAYKCEFSCRLSDFTHRSPQAVLFFGEDFYWSFKLTDRNRSSTKQRWIFWSWEAPVHHPEYTQSGLTFNWFVSFTRSLAH